MRILHLDAGGEMRGGQWQALRLIEGLRAAGVESTLLAREAAPLFAMARQRGLPVEPLGLLRVALLSRRHDLVHAHDARSHTLGALATGAPLVVSRRVAFPVGSRWKYGRPRRFLAVSEFVKGVLVAGGVPAEKIEVVYDGVPLLEPAQGDVIVAPANAGDPQKGEALAREAARLAGIELRFSTNLERDLLHAGLLVYVSHSEGLGSGVLLAMSAGVPAVASNVGGLPEVVRHGENGMLAENTPESMAAAIRQLRADPEWARRMGAAARGTVIERFTVDRMVGRTMEVYRRVLSLTEAILALLFGLIIGSFLNVCIHRWPRGRSVVRPRSHCVRCRKTIPWYDNIPVFSYLALGGKCRFCGRRISPRYPAVELVTGLLFFYFVWTLGPTPAALKMCVFSALLVALIFTDLEKRLLPDQLTLGGALIGFTFALFVPVPDFMAQMLLGMFGAELHGRAQWLAEAACGSLLPTFCLWLGGWIYEKIRHREGLGLGDVKLIAMVGAFLGLRNALLALVIGSVTGSVLGYGYIKATRQDASTYPLPFGAFLGAAALAAAIGGQRILGWYNGL